MDLGSPGKLLKLEKWKDNYSVCNAVASNKIKLGFLFGLFVSIYSFIHSFLYVFILRLCFMYSMLTLTMLLVLLLLITQHLDYKLLLPHPVWSYAGIWTSTLSKGGECFKNGSEFQTLKFLDNFRVWYFIWYMCNFQKYIVQR